MMAFCCFWQVSKTGQNFAACTMVSVRFLAKLSLRPPEKTLDLGIPASSAAAPFVKALGGLSLLVRRSQAGYIEAYFHKTSCLTDLRAQLQTALAASYTLERELGRGGMATVFLARDLRHDRPVALKVLHPDLAHALGPERFQREIKLAARLQHPHILTVHDSGEAAGQLWFTMPFVEGESLRDRLRRERQLPVDVALRIATEAARALEYAHRHHVIHRDIKPENLLLTADGSTLVADFGIARALAGADDRLTETGLAVGTPAYMSPEQAAGDKTLDARTDVYSLGAVLYEMLAGEPPFTGPTAQAIIAKRFSGEVPRVRQARASVPEQVDAAVARALAPVAADRFSSAEEFARALASAPVTTPAVATVSAPTGVAEASTTPVRVMTSHSKPPTARRVPMAAITLALGFLVGLGVLFAWRRSHGAGEESTGPKRLAVLPFENLGDSAEAYFADGMTDEVRGKLSQLSGVAVIARASSNEYRKTNKAPQQIARELGADYLLTATVRWEKAGGGPSRVRVSPELIRVNPGAAPTTKWQQPFDASLTNVFQVQAEIATKVASALNLALGDSVRHELAIKPTENLAAYDAYLKGQAASQGMSVSDPASLRHAIGFYQQAVALDQAFIPAWAELSRACSLLYANGTPMPELAAQARNAANRALALGRDRPEGQVALGDFYTFVTEDNWQARTAYEAGLKLAPTNVDLLVGAALAEQSLGRWEASLQYLTQAATLDPRSANTARRTGSSLLWLRRYRDAQVAIDRAVALAPNNLSIIEQKAMVALAQGDLPGAQGVVRAALSTVNTTGLLVFFGNYWDLYWVLDEVQQQQLLTLPPSAFDNDRGSWSIVRAQTYWLRKDPAKARVYADSAQLAIAEQLRATPEDGQRHVIRGLALAYLGRKAEAIAEGERGVALLPVSRDAYSGTYNQHQLVRIYLLVGEPEKALDRLEPLLKIPYYLSPGWLKIDPTFDALRGNPRFERLIAGG
jgi:eukaryotic-like serine/threonine-protein kinase